MLGWQVSDWVTLLPLLFFGLLALIVVIQDSRSLSRIYTEGNRSLPRLSRELVRGNRAEALEIVGALGGVVGALLEEGIQLVDRTSSTEAFKGAFACTRRLSSTQFEGGLYLLRVSALGTVAVTLLGQALGSNHFWWGGLALTALILLSEQVLRLQLLRLDETLERLQLLLLDYWQKIHSAL
ncbi:hypothetical protein [Leptolyngbya sp. FACHB-261]|uniref:hypothetical protein n=1 Tax=Leptolyngbya sp. FACHB-261 TaxID=2692806 RepID=UPI0016838D32|nr:hypothetical protein [Leptolyngbya sp. FACHB-261]